MRDLRQQPSSYRCALNSCHTVGRRWEKLLRLWYSMNHQRPIIPHRDESGPTWLLASRTYFQTWFQLEVKLDCKTQSEYRYCDCLLPSLLQYSGRGAKRPVMPPLCPPRLRCSLAVGTCHTFIVVSRLSQREREQTESYQKSTVPSWTLRDGEPLGTCQRSPGYPRRRHRWRCRCDPLATVTETPPLPSMPGDNRAWELEQKERVKTENKYADCA